ncbi:hypothetical protein [Lysobacter gummosus]
MRSLRPGERCVSAQVATPCGCGLEQVESLKSFVGGASASMLSGPA